MLLRCFAAFCVNLLKHETTTTTTCVIHVEGLTSTLMAVHGDSEIPWPQGFAHFVLRSLLPAPESAFQSHLPFQLLTVCLWTQHSALCKGEDFSSSFQVYKLQAGIFFCVELELHFVPCYEGVLRVAPICSPATTAINTHLHAATAFTYPRDRRYTVTEPSFFFLLLLNRCIALVFSIKALPRTKRSSGDPEVFTPRFWVESKELHHHGFALGVEDCQGWEDAEGEASSEGRLQGYAASFKGEQSCINTLVCCWLLGLENCPFGCWGSSLGCFETWLWIECKGNFPPPGSCITNHARRAAPRRAPWMNKPPLRKNRRG